MPFKLAAGEERQGAELQTRELVPPRPPSASSEGQPADAGSIQPPMLTASSAQQLVITGASGSLGGKV